LHRNISSRRTTLVNAVDRDDHRLNGKQPRVGCRLVSRLALAFAARGLVVDDLHQPPQRPGGTTFMSVAPWIKSYPRGVRWDAELTTMPLQQILERSAAKWADNPALDFMNRKISYRDLSDLSDRAAKGFQRLGVRPGIHVGLYLPNTPHYVIAFFGVMKAGGTVVNYSPLDAASTRSTTVRPIYS
jgi:non-ribosomal peptide synthetase component F